jgi:T1SS-143 domain-containing protein
MATDTTTNHTDANNASTIREGDVEHVQLTQAGTPVQVQVPQGENVVRVQVTPGETVELPFPTDGLVARLGDNGNLAVKVGDITVILIGYADATGQGEVTILGNDGKSVDVAAVLASTDPNLDIQTAAGPGAGDQGTGADNNGGLFAPFDPNAGIDGLNAVGGLDPTALNYNLIQRQNIEIIEADEEDTSPLVINITKPNPVNEDDLGGAQGNDSLQAKALEPYPSHVTNDLISELGTSAWFGYPNGTGNDPFDTDDHEDGSQLPGLPDDANGVDQDREPTTVTAVVSVNFFGDAPGHLSFVKGGDTPIIDQLEAMNLTSHSNELHYIVLPGSPDTDPDPNVDNSYGETLVAYYLNGDGEEASAVIVFTIAMREFNSGDDFNVDFTIYGVVDNVPGTPDAAGDISDILDIGVPFFVVDSDGSVTAVPADVLVFQDIDDTPSLGSLGCYQWVPTGEGEEGPWAWVPTEIRPSDTDIVHDETDGKQSGGQQWNDPDSHKEAQPENDVNPNGYYAWLKSAALSGAGLPSDTPVLGMAHSKLTVSFGADGKAYGNDEAGHTVFTGDGNTNAQAFQLYIGAADAPLTGGLTNWTITENGVVVDVLAEQTDANTIVGYALVGEGENQHRIEVFVLHVDPYNGDLALVQMHQINQPDPTNSDDSTPSLKIYPEGSETGVDVNFRGTDYDGDHVDAPLQVIVQDDGPTICKIEYCSEGTFRHDKGYVDEDFLTAGTNGVPGNHDYDTSPDNLNAPFGTGNNGDGKGGTHVTGQILADFGTDGPGSFSFNVPGLTDGGPAVATDWKTANGDPVTLVLVGDTLKAVAGDPAAEVFTVVLNKDTGAFSFDLQQALFHKDNDGTATNDGDTADDGTNRYEDDILIQLGVKVTDADGDIKPATLQFLVDDDAPSLICPPHTTAIENGECPVCKTEVSLAVAEQDEGCLSEETCMVTLAPGQQAPGWLHVEISVKDENGNTQGDDSVFSQNGVGYGVISGEDGGSGGRFDEINYDHTANGGLGASETLIVKIGTDACPQLALSATIELSRFYSNEGNVGNEQGHWEAWKDGVKVAEGDFTANNLNGQFGLAIPTVSGGFDELRFTALPGTSGPNGSFSDDSDYYVQNINLEIKPTHLISGEFKYSFGADDGSVAPGGVDIEFTGGEMTQGGKPVVLNEVYDAETGKTTISGYVDTDGNGFDEGDLPVFSLVLDPNASESNGVHTATYTFTQYGPLDNDGGMTNLPFEVKIQDQDHDAIKTCIDICVDDSAPETSNACATVFEKGLDQSGSAKDGTDANANSEFAHGFLNFSYNGDGPGSITAFALTSGPVAGVAATLVNGLWIIDVPQFKITVDAVTGEYNFTLKQNFTHNDTEDDGFDNREGVESTVNVGDILQELGFTYTVKDGDGTAADGGLTVKVVDDGPIMCLNTDYHGTVDIDESASNQRDDQNNNTAPLALVNVSNAGPIIEYAKDGDAVVTVDVDYGADGKGQDLIFSVSAASPNADSGLDYKDANGFVQNIVLTTEGDVVVGRVAAGVDAGKAVFAITIDQNGELEVAQYKPIYHGNTGSNDEGQGLNDSALVVTVAAMDGDEDFATKSANIGSKVVFYDDGPSIDNSSSVTLDEDAIPGANGNSGTPGNGDVSPSLYIANGDLSIAFGTDGPGKIDITLNGQAPRLTGDGAVLQFTQVGDTLIGHTGNMADPALTVKVNSDGTYTVTLLKPLDHPNGNNENDIDLQFKVKVTDNDGDSVTGSINVKIDDDMPNQFSVKDYTDQHSSSPADGSAHHGGEYGYVDEDYLPQGNQDANTNDTDDAIGGVKSIAVLQNVSVGADGGKLTINANDVNVHGDVDSGLRRSSDGAPITMVTSPDGQTITGYASNIQDDTHKVFTIKVVGNTVEFELFQALLQDNTNSNPDYNSGDNNEEGEVKFDITVKLTDNDNDVTSTVVKFLVDDDKPQAVDDGILTIAALNTETSPANGLLFNDLQGADRPVSVTGIKAGGESGSYTAVGAGKDVYFDVNGNVQGSAANAMGKLHVNADGTWSFTQFKYTSLDQLQLSYKITDADADTDTGSFKVDLRNVPPPSFTSASANVDEDGLTGGISDNINAVDGQPGDNKTGAGGGDSSEKTFGGAFSDLLDGDNVTDISLAGNAVGDFANIKNLAGQPVDVLVVSGDGHTLTAYAGGVALFSVQITSVANATFTVTLLNPIKHTDAGSEDDISATVKVWATNAGGTSQAGIVILIDDDRPTVTTLSDAQTVATVDETNLALNGTASFAGSFTSLPGADGQQSSSYTLGVKSAGVASGIVDTLTGQSVVLTVVGGAIEGRTAGTNELVFKVTVDASGTVTLDQVRSVVHSPESGPDQSTALSADDLVTLTKTVVDNDGDSVSATINIGSNLVFKDDAPDAVNDSNAVATIGSPITGNVTDNDSSGADVKSGFAKGEVTKFTIDSVDYPADGQPHDIPGYGTMTMDSHGNYSFTQTDGTAGTMNVTYTLQDADGDTDTATLAITTVADIQPINYNDKDAGNENAAQQNNVMIILDRSGSMSDDIDPNTPGTQTRLSIAIAAIENLLNTYDQIGDVKVMVVQFSTDGQRMDFWGTPAQALAYINTNSPNGNYTSYSDALSQAGSGLGDSDGKIAGAPTTVYFLSDGVPTADGANNGTDGSQDHSLTTNQQTAWNNALEGNGVTKVYAVGVGPGISANDGDLGDVANPNGNGNSTPSGEVIIVTDENGLSSELLDTITVSTIEGNVLDGSHTSGLGDLGSDAGNTPDAAGNGATHIYTFSHNGNGTAFDVEFSWDGVAGSVSQVGAGGTNVQINGKIVSFDTEFGRMEFNFQTGAYEFTPGSVGQTQNVTFHYGTKDADGDIDQSDAAGGGGDDDQGGTSIPGGADLVITINNINQAPEITSNGGGASAAINVAENSTFVTTVTATDPDGDAKEYTIIGGADAAKFTIDPATGVLSFVSAPNFESPTDSGSNNVYDVQVRVTDGNLSDIQNIAVTVTNVNEFAPVISSNGGGSNAAINVAENTTAVTTVVAADADAGTTITYSIVGGADQSKFSINPTTGALTFISAPNFEAPTDAGANNVYDVIVRASDGALADDQSIAVTVTNVAENTPPAGGVDHIYTNSDDDVTVMASWLLANDTDPNGDPLTVTNVHENTNLIFSLDDSGLPNSFVFNLSNNDTGDGSVANFDYDVTDGSATTNVGSQIHLDTSGSIDGGATNDIVIGKGDNETLVGNGGADFLIGNGGNDTLVFDAADKLVDGGSGFDRAQLANGGNTFTYDGVGSDAKFANVEMIDMGDNNDRNNSENRVNISAADVLDLGNNGTQVSAGTLGNIRIDLFVIGDTNGASANGRDNVHLTGFSAVDINGGGGGNGTFTHTDAVTGVSHTYTLYSDGGTKYIAVEQNLDIV